MYYRLSLRCMIDTAEHPVYEMECDLPDTHETAELAKQDQTIPRFYRTNGEIVLVFENAESFDTEAPVWKADYKAFKEKYHGVIKKQKPGKNLIVVFEEDMEETTETWDEIFSWLIEGGSFTTERTGFSIKEVAE